MCTLLMSFSFTRASTGFQEETLYQTFQRSIRVFVLPRLQVAQLEVTTPVVVAMVVAVVSAVM